jgi:hypothetical protein
VNLEIWARERALCDLVLKGRRMFGRKKQGVTGDYNNLHSEELHSL